MWRLRDHPALSFIITEAMPIGVLVAHFPLPARRVGLGLIVGGALGICYLIFFFRNWRKPDDAADEKRRFDRAEPYRSQLMALGTLLGFVLVWVMLRWPIEVASGFAVFLPVFVIVGFLDRQRHPERYAVQRELAEGVMEELGFDPPRRR